MYLKTLIVSIVLALAFSGCASRPGNYKLTFGLGTYYVDSYSYSSGCTSFKYYIGDSLKGFKQTCKPVKVVKLK